MDTHTPLCCRHLWYSVQKPAHRSAGRTVQPRPTGGPAIQACVSYCEARTVKSPSHAFLRVHPCHEATVSVNAGSAACTSSHLGVSHALPNPVFFLSHLLTSAPACDWQFEMPCSSQLPSPAHATFVFPVRKLKGGCGGQRVTSGYSAGSGAHFNAGSRAVTPQGPASQYMPTPEVRTVCPQPGLQGSAAGN